MKKQLKYDYDRRNHDKLIIHINGADITYNMETQNDYAQFNWGAATMREYLENIENEEMTTHYLMLEGSDWKTVIHGLVRFQVYLKGDDPVEGYDLYMVFHFTGDGTSPKRIEPHDQRLDLGRIYENASEIRLVTEDGNDHIFKKG